MVSLMRRSEPAYAHRRTCFMDASSPIRVSATSRARPSCIRPPVAESCWIPRAMFSWVLAPKPFRPAMRSSWTAAARSSTEAIPSSS